MRDTNKRAWHRNTSNITSLDISSSQQNAAAAVNHEQVGASRVTFKEMQIEQHPMEQQSTLAGSLIAATTPSNNPRRRRGLYKRINQLKEKCKFALDPPETPGETDDTLIKHIEEKDLPQSYRDHI